MRCKKRNSSKGVGILEQASRRSKTGVKRENFSPIEKRIAKIGLGVTVPVAVLYALHLAFPDAREIASVFAGIGVLLLLLAASCIFAEPAEAAAIRVKKAAGFGLQFAKSYNARRNPAFTKTIHRKTSNRTRARSRASRSRRSHTVSGASSSGSSETSGDSDPPEPPHEAVHRVRQPRNLKDQRISDIPPLPRHCLQISGCWRISFCRIRGCC